MQRQYGQERQEQGEPHLRRPGCTVGEFIGCLLFCRPGVSFVRPSFGCYWLEHGTEEGKEGRIFFKNRGNNQNEASPPKEEDEEAPVTKKPKKQQIFNVLVVGTLQHGKSSFLRFLHEYAGVDPPPSLLVGDGNSACTTVPTTYDLSVTPMAYHVKGEDRHTAPLTVRTSEDVVRMVDTTNLSRKPKPVAKQEIRLCILDTPGLNEADEKDEDHILNILAALQRMDSITAVVFVVNATAPFSADFLRFFNYYREMVPELSSRFIVVHSHWGLRQRLEQPDKVGERVNVFVDKTKHRCEHFFINSVIKEDVFSPKAAHFDRALSFAVVTSLLTYLMAKESTPLRVLRYRKSPNVKQVNLVLAQMHDTVKSNRNLPISTQVERLIDTACRERMSGYTAGIHVLDDQKGEISTEVEAGLKEMAEIKAAIGSKRQRLYNIDDESSVELGSDTADASWQFFNGYVTRKLSVLPAHRINHIKTSVLDGYKCTFSKEEYSQDNHLVECEVTTGFWRNLNGTIVAYAVSSNYYQGEIRDLNLELASLRAREQELLAKISDGTARRESLGNRKKEIEQFLENLAILLQTLSEDYYPIQSYLDLRPIFSGLLASSSAVSNEDIERFRTALGVGEVMPHWV